MGIFQRGANAYPQAPSRRQRLFIAGIVLIVVMAIFSLLFLRQPAAPDKFLSLVRKGDAKASYELTSDSFRTTTSSKDWEGLVGRISRVYTGDTKKVTVQANPLPQHPAINELHTYELQGEGGPYKIDIYTTRQADSVRISMFNATTIPRN